MSYGVEQPVHPLNESTLFKWTGHIRNFCRGLYRIVNTTSAYTIAEQIFYIRVDATSGAVTITLPKAATYLGRRILVKKVDASANAVTVSRTGSDTIEGSNTVSLAAQWDSLYIIAGASGSWEIIAQ